MIKKTEICTYCGEDYIPKRRGAQKFCSNSCRSRNWQTKQNKLEVLSKNETGELKSKNEGQKKDSISVAGVSNAAIAIASVDIIKHVFTPEDNKTATKGDLNKLASLIKGQRYFPIKNLANDAYGKKPYYDIQTNHFIYLNFTS